MACPVRDEHEGAFATGRGAGHPGRRLLSAAAKERRCAHVHLTPHEGGEARDLGFRELEPRRERGARVGPERLARARDPARRGRAADPVMGAEDIDAQTVGEVKAEHPERLIPSDTDKTVDVNDFIQSPSWSARCVPAYAVVSLAFDDEAPPAAGRRGARHWHATTPSLPVPLRTRRHVGRLRKSSGSPHASRSASGQADFLSA